MRIDRNTLRTVVPPVLALGLVALVTHPVDAVPLDPPQALAATGGTTAAVPARVIAADGVAVQTVVPSVSFQEQLRVVDGRLRTAVLVNTAEPAGRARILEIPGCRIDLAPGVAGWLDCAYTGSATITVEVLLADGRRMTHSDAPTVS